MKYKHIRYSIGLLLLVIACTVSNPKQNPLGDGSSCAAAQPLRCEGSALVHCNSDGTAEVKEACSAGCNTVDLRCVDPVPSNGLAQYLDQSTNPPDLDLGDTATINTDTGDVTVGGAKVNVSSESAIQPGSRTIRVFAVRSLTAKDVVIIGTNAIAVVSRGDLKILGKVTASAKPSLPT